MKLILAIALVLIVFVLARKAPSKSYDDNLYDKTEGSSKGQSDSASNKYYALHQNDLYDNENFKKNKNQNDLYKDDFRSSDNFADNYNANRNKKVKESDDYDKDFNAIRYKKNNADAKNQQKRTSFSQDLFTQDGAPEVTDARFNQNSLKKRNSDYQRKNSNAGHQESTINENKDLGFNKGSSISHSSSKKHQQKHGFGNSNENAWNDEIAKKDLHDSKKISLNIKKKKTRFDDLDENNFRNNDQLAFDKKNSNDKRRIARDLASQEDLNRNKFGSKKLDKIKFRNQNYDSNENVNRDKAASRKDQKDQRDNVDHQYENQDFRNKKITNDQKKH